MNAILLDGSMGLYLQSKIGDLGKYPELTNISHASQVREIHAEYAAAGAQITTSNTFLVSPYRSTLAEYDITQMLMKSLTNALSAGLPIALDIGPLGRLLEPYGELSADDVYAEFAAVISAGAPVADYVLLETFADLREIEIALRAANECCSKPVFVTATFRADGTTYMGATVEQFAACANMCGANVVGFNCTLNPLEAREVFDRFKACTDIPLLVQPNQIEGAGADEFADAMMWYVERGAAYVGGCCGTTPAHIKALGDRIRDAS
ncbi:MAG: homocysteine S-methyltransferase family protein [Oscillospiraceae bacterium]|jgi:5-methyltetrahydrofolate--homocysteine methyltransferase|nr:homocysteine S-methyltransferase family protein [Oscillospiraceae bacterium]